MPYLWRNNEDWVATSKICLASVSCALLNTTISAIGNTFDRTASIFYGICILSTVELRENFTFLKILSYFQFLFKGKGKFTSVPLSFFFLSFKSRCLFFQSNYRSLYIEILLEFINAFYSTSHWQNIPWYLLNSNVFCNTNIQNWEVLDLFIHHFINM